MDKPLIGLHEPIADYDMLNGVASDYYDSASTGLLDRWQPLTEWLDARTAAGLFSSCQIAKGRVGPRTEPALPEAAGPRCVNFASQDYLSLSAHPRIIDAATEAARTYGMHSAGSTPMMGLSLPLVALERRVAHFLGLGDATVFPTGWSAGYGCIRALVQPGDHVVIDMLAHPCLQEAARAATPYVHVFPHLSTEAVERRLVRIREDMPHAGILVVTEGLFSMDSDQPDLPALQALATRYEATLLVNVAHDLGALGQTGRGVLELQGMLGRMDVVMGSFSKAFASNGGFVASNHPALKYALRFGAGPQTHSSALSPVQAAAVLAAFDIVDSAEGHDRRQQLAQNVEHLRYGLGARSFSVLGNPSAIVPVRIGPIAVARPMTAEILRLGALVNLVEYPAVPKTSCRWQMQVMADHSPDDIDRLIVLAEAARTRMVTA